MSRIPQSTVNEIFEAANVVEVIGDFIPLKKRGKEHWAKSPFTNEKTPSFAVNGIKNIWKDFSTGKGGNSVSYLMEAEGMTYPEALRYLATKYNIAIVEDDAADNEQAEDIGAIKAVVKRAAEIFHSHVDHVRSYLNNRGITDESITHWQIGHSPDQSECVGKQLLTEGYSREVIVKANICTDFDGRLIDRFRGRVMFPICDAFGNVLAFGGRSLREGGAKYINSSETPIYHKGKALFGLHHARKAIMKTDRVILVEGYMDVIMMHQQGQQSSIATCGTALTTDQCKIIGRYAQSILIARDSDKAGLTATERDLKVILSSGRYPSVLPFPIGEDPDSFAKRVGADALDLHVSKNARNFVDFLVAYNRKQCATDGPEQVAIIVKACKEVLDVIHDNVLRFASYKRLAEILGLPDGLLRPKPIEGHKAQPMSNGGMATMHAHEMGALSLIVNHGNDELEGSTLGRTLVDMLAEFPLSSLSPDFGAAIDALRNCESFTTDSLISNAVLHPIVSRFIEVRSVIESDAVQQVNAIVRDFTRHHYECLIAECKAAMLTAVDNEAKEKCMMKFVVLTKAMRAL